MALGSSSASAKKSTSGRPARYSAYDIFKRGVTHEDWPRTFTQHDLKKSYDVVIIGAGVHGLACAYYLAKNHGITNVAVLDKAYMGGGGSGRNTAIIRSNYLTPEGVRFYDRSVKLWNVADGSLVRSIDVHNGAVFDLAWHPGGRLLASASADETVKLWRTSLCALLFPSSKMMPMACCQRKPQSAWPTWHLS